MEEKLTSTVEDLTYQRKSIYETADEETMAAIFSYASDYAAFLDNAKTEREAVNTSLEMAIKAGYTPFTFGEKLKAGDLRYYNNRGKNLFLIRKGTAPLDKDGIRIMAAHIDSPRIDLKQNPLYEDSQMAFFKTHYYGGLRKYQWLAIPLAIHGTVVLQSGEIVHISLGEEESEPVFYINDLLPHLAREQATKPMASAVSGESLNILIGGIPCKSEDVNDKIKQNILELLFDKYQIKERDFQSAELCVVPAFKARDIGFDRAFIGAYGHDDRVCAYPALTAMIECEDKTHTILTILADKEETGSDSPSGMQCDLMLDIIGELADKLGGNERVVRLNSKCLSADVSCAFDPNFADAFEKTNTPMLGCGAVFMKYTGSGGKGGTNDACAEYIGWLRSVLAKENVVWQTGELGKVDRGGGGTVAKFISKHNIETIDLGVPVISMHAPVEVIAKVDLYETHRAFSAFFKY